jgi:hypothetical protein
LRAFTILGGGSGRDVDPTSEEQARSLAAAIGPGVAYVSSTPVKTATAQGRDALYSFTDITQLRISEQPQMPGGLSVRAQGLTTDPITFALTRRPDGVASLKILVPRPSVLPFGPSGTTTRTSSAGPDQIAMFKQLLAGARLSVAVEPAGHVVATSSPYVDGDRVTLIDVDVDEAMKDPTVVERLRSSTTLEEAKGVIAGVPGLKIILDPEITIEFMPNR